jgi:hypothetical protein
MFILIGGAYRQIEIEHNPLLREARRKAAESYESGPTSDSKFKSRRPENSGDFKNFFYEEGGS